MRLPMSKRTTPWCTFTFFVYATLKADDFRPGADGVDGDQWDCKFSLRSREDVSSS